MKRFLDIDPRFLRFVLGGLGLIILWVVIETWLPEWVYTVNFYLVLGQSIVSVQIIEWMGYYAHYEYGSPQCLSNIVVEASQSVCVGSGCSGLELFLIFTAFIMLVSGDWKNKIWFLPLGLFTVLVLNIIRIVALSLINYHHPEWVDFNHKYTFVLIVYGAIIYLWWLWVSKIAISKPATASGKEA